MQRSSVRTLIISGATRSSSSVICERVKYLERCASFWMENDYGCLSRQRLLHLPPTLGPWTYRIADPAVLEKRGGFDLVAPSPISLRIGGLHSGDEVVIVPRELTVAEAEDNVIEAGFDGVEVHAANDYLLDQFLQTVSNGRTGECGRSVDCRERFLLEVIDAAVETERTAVCINPWFKFQGEEWTHFPLHTFIERIHDAHPNFAYIHVVKPRIDSIINGDVTDEKPPQSKGVSRNIWGDRPYIAAGGMDLAPAIDTVEKYGGWVAFGRHFKVIPNTTAARLSFAPEGGALTRYNRDTSYTMEAAVGYIDYPFANNVVALQA
ncbi:hypothetical protein H4582DRAFT_2056070 [Lactarius indigo]|nr:hypothetical protein H4582DRAFT_2056070 [Lactarius indigo]